MPNEKPSGLSTGRAMSVQEFADNVSGTLARIADDGEPVTLTLDGRPVVVISPPSGVSEVAQNIDAIQAEHAKAPLDRKPTGRRISEVMDDECY